MTRSAPRFVLCALTSGLLLSSCGDEKAARQAQVQAARASIKAWGQPRTIEPLPAASQPLVPADAAGLVACRNPGAMLDALRASLEGFQPGLGQAISLDPVVLLLGLRSKDLDLTRPAAIALTTDGKDVATTVVVAARNAEESAAIVEAPTATAGDFLAIGIGTEPKTGSAGPALGTALPKGDLSVRLDLSRLGEAWVPKLRAAFSNLLRSPNAERLPPQIAAILSERNIETLCDLLAEATELRAGITLRDGHLDLDIALDIRPGSAFELAEQTANPVDVAQALPASRAPITVMYGTNWAYALDLADAGNRRIAERLPPDQARQFLAGLDGTKRFYRALIGFGALTLDYGADGLAVLAAFGSPDPAAFVKTYAAQMRRNPAAFMPGALAEDIRDVPLLGAPFVSGDIVPDRTPLPEGLHPQQLTGIKGNRLLSRALIGRDRVRVLMGARKPFVLIASDQPDAATGTMTKLAKSIETRAPGTPANPILTHVVERLHAVPTWLCALDARAALAGLRGAIASFQKIPEPPAGEPVPVWLSVSASGPSYQLQMHVDLAGVAELAAAMRAK